MGFKIGNNIDDAGATHIAEALKVNTILTSVDLSSEWIISLKLREQDVFTDACVFKIENRIGVVGAAHIAEALKVNTTLTSTNLGGKHINILLTLH